MRIAVIGTGYVGLVTGACLAELGHRVLCIDCDANKIALLRSGAVPIHEPGLAPMIAANVAAGRIDFTTSSAAVLGAQAVFLAVGTPQQDSDGAADLTALTAAATDVMQRVTPGTVIVVKSTVPAGTGDALAALATELRPFAGLAVASNPEFLREGAAIADFMQPDRIVIGAACETARAILRDVYAPFGAEVPRLVTARRNAELIKYASNAFLALKIAFINEMADLCESAEADISEVAKGMGLDPRIGPRFLVAGPGYGGSCFPKDTAALVHQARRGGTSLALVETAIRSNARRKRAMAQRIVQGLGGSVAGKRLGVLGLTFKANTDDMRDSPALVILPELQAQGAIIQAHDPGGMAAAAALLPGVAMCAEAADAAAAADALVVLTEWPEYRALDAAALGQRMAGRHLFDFRNHLDRDSFAAAGFIHAGLGRAHPPELKEKTADDRRIVSFPAHSGGRRSGIPGVASGRPARQPRRAGVGGGHPGDRPH